MTVGSPWALAIHGGAGAIAAGDLTPAQDAAYRQALEVIIQCGGAVLRDGGTALDAVEIAVRAAEDNPLFNAGRGSVFTADGRIEMDAAIMDGTDLRAGAAAGVTATLHPISVARAIMERTDHVMLAGAGADAFAVAEGLEIAEPGALATKRRWMALEQTLSARGLPVPPRPEPLGASVDHAEALVHDEGKRGTVGAVACDSFGHVAAATSTGGITGKQWGRIGDSPIIGAGVYANDAACAVSATGAGEYFIRLTVAHRIASLVELRGMTLQSAVDQVVQRDLTALGGEGGVIAVTPSGDLAWSFNTSGMYRARMASGRSLEIGIYKDVP